MKKKLISVIIPGYNEQTIIVNTIVLVEKILTSLKRPFEIFIIDDGSKDATPNILRRLIKTKKHPNLRFYSYKSGPSRRENLARSFKMLKGEYIVLLDMDLSMDLRHIKEMIYWLEHGYGMVIPNRYHKKSHIRRDPRRYVISKLYNIFIRILFRTGFEDNICGFKAFKADIIKQLVEDAGIDKTGERSVFWDTEILIHAKRRRVKIKEIPIHWVEGKNSALSFRNEKSILSYTIKFWLRSK